MSIVVYMNNIMLCYWNQLNLTLILILLFPTQNPITMYTIQITKIRIIKVLILLLYYIIVIMLYYTNNIIITLCYKGKYDSIYRLIICAIRRYTDATNIPDLTQLYIDLFRHFGYPLNGIESKICNCSSSMKRWTGIYPKKAHDIQVAVELEKGSFNVDGLCMLSDGSSYHKGYIQGMGVMRNKINDNYNLESSNSNISEIDLLKKLKYESEFVRLMICIPEIVSKTSEAIADRLMVEINNIDNLRQILFGVCDDDTILNRINHAMGDKAATENLIVKILGSYRTDDGIIYKWDCLQHALSDQSAGIDQVAKEFREN
eukprot:394536_1